jgi:hypothetical protein
MRGNLQVIFERFLHENLNYDPMMSENAQKMEREGKKELPIEKPGFNIGNNMNVFLIFRQNDAGRFCKRRNLKK